MGCLSVGGSAAEVFKRCGSAFRAEGWRALEELGAVGGGLVGGLYSLFVLQGLGLRLRAVPRGALRAGKRLCGLDKALSARWPPSIGVEIVGLVKVLVVLHNTS